ncbi:hypothetical protein [Actinomadura violacea]|uniref:Uncharacterized protein n=1 Tax=Actinomadura violacea TaxID=2819934 RepID=A0ABS3RRT3_9ACTN|nr:hypothetical protein [Actinomadura violacea]MBO2459362.1 hypothetical protein [Actinomadura violacea]
MSADQAAAAMFGAGITLLVMAAAVVWAVAHVYQGAHAARLDRERRDAARARAYHRLSPDERRIWRTGEHPAAAAPPPGAVPFRGGEGASRDGAGSWRTAHAA